jgi:hypothetical protein
MKKIGKGFSPFAKIDDKGEYFCGKCGKAGFTERKKINGHIGGCNGAKDLLEELGTTTTTTAATTTQLGNFSSSASKMASYGLSSSLVDSAFGLVGSSAMNLELARMKEEMSLLKKTTTNHISHLSGLSGGFGDILSDRRVQVAIVVIGIVAILYILEKGDQKTKVTMGGKLLDFAMKKL